MSVQAITWAFATDAGDSSAKVVLLALANYADDEGQCWPSQKKLASMCNLSERTVREAMTRLEDRNLISRRERVRHDGGRSTDMITLRPTVKSSGGVQEASAAHPQRNLPLPPAASAGLTTFEPSDEPRGKIPSARKARKPEVSIPESFPDETEIIKAEERVADEKSSVDVRRQAERFRLHAEQNDRRCRDWAAAWRNWIIGAIDKERPANVVPLNAPPSEDRQRAWMQDWLAAPHQWKRADRGPAPDEDGCRISATIMTEFGHQPRRAM